MPLIGIIGLAGGWTAVMYVSNEGHTEIAVSLINARAQLDLKNDVGRTASELASARDYLQIAQALYIEPTSNQQQTHH